MNASDSNVNTAISFRFFLGFSFLALALRILAALISNFERDEAEIYTRASDFFLTGVPSSQGAEVVYSGTRLPGALQDLLMGIPLYFSGGHPWGAAVFVGFLSFGAAWILYLVYKEVFIEIDRKWVFLFLLFAPWSVVFVKLWNPTYLPFLMAVFLLGFLKVLKGSKSFWGAFCLSIAPLLALQLHMSFVLLLGALFYIALRYYKKLNYLGLMTGLLLGSLTLMPYFFSSENQVGAPSVNVEVASKNVITSNLVFEPRNLKEIPRILFRFASFATGETSRFFREGGGTKRIVEVINLTPVLWPGFIFGIFFSALFTVFGVSFFFRKTIWQGFWGRLPFALNKSRNSKATGQSGHLRHAFDDLTLVILLMTCFSFVFSIKGPTSHTFWILSPLSFYPLFRVLEMGKNLKFKGLVFNKIFLMIYLFATLSYSMIAPYRSPYVAPLILSEVYWDQENYPYRFHHGVGVIRRLERLKSKPLSQ